GTARLACAATRPWCCRATTPRWRRSSPAVCSATRSRRYAWPRSWPWPRCRPARRRRGRWPPCWPAPRTPATAGCATPPPAAPAPRHPFLGAAPRARALPAPALEVVGVVAEHSARGGPSATAGALPGKLAGAEPRLAEVVVNGLARGWPRGRAVALDDGAEK